MSTLVDALENAQDSGQPIVVLELVDVSDKMMFNRSKAEQALN